MPLILIRSTVLLLCRVWNKSGDIQRQSVRTLIYPLVGTIIMHNTKSSSGSVLSRRKVVGFCVFVGLIVVAYAAKEKYLYSGGSLQPVTRLLFHTKTALWDGSEGSRPTMNPWDTWMMQNPKLTSIGDIYDKCDNMTQKKVGKVVLEVGKDGVSRVTSYMNISYDHDIVTSSAHLKIFYEGDLFYEKDYDVCKAALKLSTPYTCPVPKGKILVVRDATKLPWYIPRGKYKLSASMKDQHSNDIGCSFAEFKTG